MPLLVASAVGLALGEGVVLPVSFVEQARPPKTANAKNTAAIKLMILFILPPKTSRFMDR